LDWFAVTHTIFLQKIQNELVLMQLDCVSGAVPFNCYTKKETSRTKVTTFEVLGEKLNILQVSIAAGDFEARVLS